ncbi:MAG: IS3 family transposase [Chitinophagales bacterium]|nr:IS3 family transposase [Chitinophagales bacterium]
MSYSLNELYKVVGISKQAVYQYAKRQEVFDTKTMQLVREAELLRAEHPGCGVEKMYYSLAPDFMGRDRFIELFMDLGFRLKRKKNYHRTTMGSKVYYPNFIQGMLLHSPSQVWQSDITYIKVGERFYYAVFIIDVYTKKIVGYHVSDSLRAEANVTALKMALKTHKEPQIHHSDKGSQYIYRKYITMLKDNNAIISMGETALDNAYAERINLTIKSEYLDYWQPQNLKELKAMVAKAVKHYNNTRLHNAIKRKAPIVFEKEVLLLPKQSRPSGS